MSHKEATGHSYDVSYEGDQSCAHVNCSYQCPHCQKEVSAKFDVEPVFFDTLDRGIFFEPLVCTNCGSTSDVSFGGAMETKNQFDM